MEFEWHEDKNRRNIKKHGVDFRRASEIWKGGAPVELARRIVGGEERIKAVGQIEGRYITVVYTERGERIRLISARPAHRTERHG